MQLNNLQRIIAEDFQQDDQALINTLAPNLNEFMAQTIQVVNGQLGFDNVVWQLVKIDVTVDASGKPLKSIQFNSKTVNPTGMQVISARNITKSNIYPTSQPFISFNPQGDGLVNIVNITGLPANNKFTLTFIVY
jgi:hypothetical protein